MAGWLQKFRWLSDPVFWLFAGGFLARALVGFFLNPGFDEAYYYLYSRHLHWSYFDHPPLVALTTGLGWWVTGIISPFTIRIGALGVYTLSLVLLYQVAQYLFSTAVARMTVAIATLVPLFTIGFGILTSPDNTLILFWTITLYWAAIEFFPETRPAVLGKTWEEDPAVVSVATYEPTWRISLLGFWIGLACLSKYHGFILGLSLVLFCLTHRPYRKVFQSPWLGAACLIFGLTLVPLLYWNVQHDWISFRFQLSMRFAGGEKTGFNLLQMIGYWLINIAYLFPSLGFPLWWITGQQLFQSLHLQSLRIQSFYQVTHQRGASWLAPRPAEPQLSKSQPLVTQSSITVNALRQKQRLILWISLPIMLGFTVLGGSQQILPAWPAPGFWGMTLLLAHQATQWQQRYSRRVRRWLWASGLVTATLAAVALLHLTTGTFQRPGKYALFGGWVPPYADASTELIDTTQLRQQMGQSPIVLQALQKVAFVFTNEYYLGGYIDMALHPIRPLPVTCFSQDPRGFAFWFNQEDWLGQDALYITREQFHQQPDITDEYRQHFHRLEEIAQLPLRRGGEIIAVFHVYRGDRFLKPYLYPY